MIDATRSPDRSMGPVVDRLLSWYRRLAYARPRRQHDDFSIALPFPTLLAERAEPRVAVMIHLFHADMAPMFRTMVEAIDIRADLLLTTDTDAKAGEIAAAFAGFRPGRVHIRLTPNRGRDIQPKLTAFRDLYEEYDLLLFLHGKKSTHMSVGGDWRGFLFDHLLGSPAVVRSIIDIFAANPDVGLAFPQHFEPLRRFISWGPGGNFAAAQDVARRMGMRLRPWASIDFPSGSMFWCRPAALRALLDLDLAPNDFAPEAGQTDGTIAHAVERLFLFSAEKAGYRWIKLAVPAHFSRQDTIVRLDDATGTGAFLDRHSYRLMRTGN